MTLMGFRSYDDGQHEVDAPAAPDAPGVEPVEVADRGSVPTSEPEESGMDAARVHLGHEDASATLSDRDRRILEFERQWWKYAGAKEQAIRDLFDMSGTRYYQILNGLIDTPEALAADPMLVKRLRRMRAARQRARSARRLGIDLTAE
jgi:hypothetical protein